MTDLVGWRDAPADRAGIKVEDENKWITIIQNAVYRKMRLRKMNSREKFLVRRSE